MTKKFDFIIPARMASSRLPGKVLRKLGGRAIIDWVYENCLKSRYCGNVIVGTDAQEVVDHCNERGYQVRWTHEHNCCSNRSAEVASELKSEWVVEVQSDEPFLWASLMDEWLDQVQMVLSKAPQAEVFISAAELSASEGDNPNFVKVIVSPSGRLLWASRSKIPSDFKKGVTSRFFRHTGFYFWQRNGLLKFAKIEPGPVEKSEDTHSLRFVENDILTQVVPFPETQGIDVMADLEAAELYIKNNPDVITKNAAWGAQ